MNQSIKVSNDVCMQILNNLNGQFSADFLNLFNEFVPITFHLMLENGHLHFIVVFEEIVHGFIDQLELSFQFIVDFLSHPRNKAVYIATALHFHALRTITEVPITIFLLEFAAQFCEDSEDGWAFDGNVSTFDFALWVGWSAFGNLPSDEVVSVFLDFALVLFLLLSLSTQSFLHFAELFPFDVVCLVMIRRSSLRLLVRKFKLVNCILIILAHPLLIFHLLKQGRHEILELLIVGETLPILRVDNTHQVVEHKHNEVIVIATDPLLEDYLGVSEVVVMKGLTVVHIVNGCLELHIYFCGIGEGILGWKVCEHFLNMPVNQFYFCCI
jgi:hypothetical protein